MKDEGMFSKFNNAADALRATRSICRSDLRPLYDVVLSAISEGQRFYLPDAYSVLEGREFSPDIKDTFRLPYDCICLLASTEYEESPTWTIAVAVDPHGAFNARHRLSSSDATPGPGFQVIAVTYHPVMKTWALYPYVCFVVADPNTNDGIRFHLNSDSAVVQDLIAGGTRPEKLIAEISDDAMAVMNLCAMLSLHNVGTKQIEPPEKLNRSRQIRGKKPLYSYHVLEVDGELWDSHGSATGDGNGFRSHLRRGHIRRLEDGKRRVWVRATFVRGGVPGFVDKDYRAVGGVKTP